jgi:hypothetical protein
MFENYYGLIELVFTSALVIGFCFWQLRATEKAKKKLAEEQARRDTDA